MTESPLNYFEIAKELNECFSVKLKEKQWHFRGNRNSYSLISLSHDTPEVGLSGFKTRDEGVNAIESPLNKKLRPNCRGGKKVGRSYHQTVYCK